MARCFLLGLAKFHPSNLKRKMVTETSITVMLLYTLPNILEENGERKWCVQVSGHNVPILIRTFLKLASLPSPPLWKLLVLLKFMEATVWFASCCLHWAIPLFKWGHHLVVCRLFNWCHCQCPSLCLCVSFFFFFSFFEKMIVYGIRLICWFFGS